MGWISFFSFFMLQLLQSPHAVKKKTWQLTGGSFCIKNKYFPFSVNISLNILRLQLLKLFSCHRQNVHIVLGVKDKLSLNQAFQIDQLPCCQHIRASNSSCPLLQIRLLHQENCYSHSRFESRSEELYKLLCKGL